jgi:mRNA-degrading endonuclease RelE of RelBE toxin-antitoxin system
VYEVLIECSAERDLKSLPTSLFHRIVSRIKASGPLGELLLISMHLERSEAVEGLERLKRACYSLAMNSHRRLPSRV